MQALIPSWNELSPLMDWSEFYARYVGSDFDFAGTGFKMTPQEHLQKIIDKCRANLALAEKRTPGKWKTDAHLPRLVTTNDDKLSITYSETCDGLYPQREDNAAFIAACAGAAEAGWRSTIAAIEYLSALCAVQGMHAVAWDGLNSIIAAWPEELL